MRNIQKFELLCIQSLNFELSAYQASIWCTPSQKFELETLVTISCATFKNSNVCVHEVQILNLMPTKLTLGLYKLKDSNLCAYEVRILKLILTKLVTRVHTFWIPNICAHKVQILSLACVYRVRYLNYRVQSLSFKSLHRDAKEIPTIKIRK